MTIAIRTIEVARREKLEEVREQQDTHSTFGRFAICGVVRDETEVFGRSSHLVNIPGYLFDFVENARALSQQGHVISILLYIDWKQTERFVIC